VATRLLRADGTIVDLDAIAQASPADKLSLITDIMARHDADDADKFESSSGYTIEAIQIVLDIPETA